MAKRNRQQFIRGFGRDLPPVAAVVFMISTYWIPMQAGGADENAPAKSPQTKPHHRAGHDAVPEPDPKAVIVPPGYQVQVAVKDLNFPTSVELDSEGNLLVAEAGPVPGHKQGKPRILRVTADGQQETLVEQGLEAPVNDLLWHENKLYVSHRGKISVLENEHLRDLVTGLPSHGDHHNNQITAGPDGKLYFGQGTATKFRRGRA